MCDAPLEMPLPNHLPYDFTHLNDVDACEIGDMIGKQTKCLMDFIKMANLIVDLKNISDVIGYTTQVSKKTQSKENNDYKTVTICSHYPKADGEKVVNNKFL